MVLRGGEGQTQNEEARLVSKLPLYPGAYAEFDARFKWIRHNIKIFALSIAGFFVTSHEGPCSISRPLLNK